MSSNSKWTKETCFDEAKKYNTRNEFRKGNNRAYQVARINGWLDSYTWFKVLRKKWNYDACFEEAKKYKSRGEFSKENGGAYNVARKNGWLDDYDWFEYLTNK